LKNAGYLPPELQDRKEAIELRDMLDILAPWGGSIAQLADV